MKNPSIEVARQLNGHTADINSLDIRNSASSSSPLLLSGSDDGTARIWDVRVSESSSQTFCMTQGPVTAVAWDKNEGSGCFVATETVLSWYDLRMERPTVIFESQDEINQIVSSRRHLAEHKTKKQQKKNKTAIIPTVACADDTGQVNLWSPPRSDSSSADHSNTPPPSWEHCRTLSHASDSLVLSCALDEHDKYLVTGTSDCFVRLWSWTTGQLLSQSSITAGQQQQEEQQQQLYNPPMIHTLTWMPSFPCFVAGCGDGSLVIGNAQGVWLSRVDAAHGGPVAACCPFGKDPEWGSLASTGNDGRIVLWNMQSLLWSSRTSHNNNHNTKESSSSCRDWLFGNVHEKNHDDMLHLNDAMETWSLKQEPETLLAWDHVGMNKPNDMVHSDESTLFLADTSPNITMYTIRPGD